MKAWRRDIAGVPPAAFKAKPGQGLTDDGPLQGLPIGGLGTGSIGIDYLGRFARWHLNPGDYRYGPAPGCYLSVTRDGRSVRLDASAGPGVYEALYPVATRTHQVDDLDLDVTVRQWSPVVPGNYEESGWPVGFFEVELRSPRPGTVRVALHFDPPAGAFPDLRGSVAVSAEGGSSAAVPLIAGAVAPLIADVEVTATGRAVFALAWDLPLIAFGERREKRWWRSHTRRFGTGGDAALRIVREALDRRGTLATAIAEWHRSLDARLRAAGAPDWLLPALLNELYLVAEGGTAWVAGPESADPGSEEHFGILECLDYPFYETLDVRYYSSFALLELWPRLEALVTRDFIAALHAEDQTPIDIGWLPGERAPRMRAGAAPHDLGAPGGDPFRSPNAYALQDSTRWKDLNPKLVLLLARNLAAIGADPLLDGAWPAADAAIRYLEAFDADRDGIPENEGVPDQTYDTWPMRGVSAYCSDLWVAALAAGERLARRAGDVEEARRLHGLRARAADSAENAIWTGTHYRFDSSGGPLSDTVIADQLAGTWYALLLGLDPVHPPDRVEKALTTVLASNFYGYARGTLGPVNGRSPDGGPAGGGEQASEVWIGVAWSLASLCLLLGRRDDAWRIGSALYETLYERSGLWFRTPEAWTEDGRFRAAMYHRPLAVWSLLPALDRART